MQKQVCLWHSLALTARVWRIVPLQSYSSMLAGCCQGCIKGHLVQLRAEQTGNFIDCHARRMCIRFIPVELVCHADLEDIKRTAKTLIEKHFPADESSPSVSFAVFYEHRASVKLDRMEVINSIVDEIPQVT